MQVFVENFSFKYAIMFTTENIDYFLDPIKSCDLSIYLLSEASNGPSFKQVHEL